MNGQDGVEQRGRILQALPHETFLVELQSGLRIRAHLAGEMRQRVVRVALGDTVAVTLMPFDGTRGRITRRLP